MLCYQFKPNNPDKPIHRILTVITPNVLSFADPTTQLTSTETENLRFKPLINEFDQLKLNCSALLLRKVSLVSTNSWSKLEFNSNRTFFLIEKLLKTFFKVTNLSFPALIKVNFFKKKSNLSFRSIFWSLRTSNDSNLKLSNSKANKVLIEQKLHFLLPNQFLI